MAQLITPEKRYHINTYHEPHSHRIHPEVHSPQRSIPDAPDLCPQYRPGELVRDCALDISEKQPPGKYHFGKTTLTRSGLLEIYNKTGRIIYCD